MPHDKLPPKLETTEETSGNIVNEEIQKLKTPHFIPKSFNIDNKNNYYIVITFVIISFFMTLFFANISKIKLYIKEREVLNTLNNEFPDLSEKPKKLIWKNEQLNIREVKKEINQYSKQITLSYEPKEDFYKRDEPKISLIIPVYNKEKYIKPLYASIQRQSLKDIEIIFIDDLSKDKSIEIIEEYMIIDKRIILIKHDKNRRTFYSRNEAAKIAKGKYLLIIDPDDLIINNILEKSYITAEKNNLDITQFYIIWGNFKKMELTNFKYKDGILYQPEMKNIFYHGETRNLCDKLIKKEVFLKSIDFMNSEFREERYEVHDDDTIFYGLIKMAKSFGFLEQIGYFYNLGVPDSTTKTKFKSEKINKIFKTLFTIMKYYYIQSDDNRKEKLLVAYQFFFRKVYIYIKHIKYLSEGFDFINNVLDLYIKCNFLFNIEKIFLSDFKNKIIQEKKRKNSNYIIM